MQACICMCACVYRGIIRVAKSFLQFSFAYSLHDFDNQVFVPFKILLQHAFLEFRPRVSILIYHRFIAPSRMTIKKKEKKENNFLTISKYNFIPFPEIL